MMSGHGTDFPNPDREGGAVSQPGANTPLPYGRGSDGPLLYGRGSECVERMPSLHNELDARPA